MAEVIVLGGKVTIRFHGGLPDLAVNVTPGALTHLSPAQLRECVRTGVLSRLAAAAGEGAA